MNQTDEKEKTTKTVSEPEQKPEKPQRHFAVLWQGTNRILLVAASVFLVAALSLAVILFLQQRAGAEKLATADGKIAELETARDAAEQELAALNAERTNLLAQVAELIQGTDERLTALEAQIAEKNASIDSLNAAIESYRGIYAVDIREQVGLVNEITDLIENGAPLHNLKEGVDPEQVHVGDLDAEGNEITERDLYDYPRTSVYYEDIATGFKYTYHADDVVFSASVIKAMYIVSVLEDVSAAYDKAVALRENADVPLVFENEIYDIENRVWTLTDAAKKEGSGVLSDMAAGTQFTYLDLVRYAIEKSDNTAFFELRETFGFDSFYALARELGVTSLSASFNNLSAQDAGAFLKHIYAFIESDKHYGPLLREYMTNTNHNVLIPAAVRLLAVAHKYGWDEDAYHDAAIVYADKPYVLVIMTDMDEGGDEVNAYIREIAARINQLHKNFYG